MLVLSLKKGERLSITPDGSPIAPGTITILHVGETRIRVGCDLPGYRVDRQTTNEGVAECQPSKSSPT